MDVLQALILGIIQGAAEFLPISSSAHLIVVPYLFGWPQPGLAFSMVLHLGTLTAVISYFLRDFLNMAGALARGVASGRPWAEPDSRLALLLLLGSVPAGLIGLFFADMIEERFYTEAGLRQGLFVIGVMLVIVALLLLLAERVSKQELGVKDIGVRRVLVIGVAQALALVPGVSRSGSTITAGLFTGLTRPAAAEFSFLLGTPIIAVAALKKVLDFARSSPEPPDLLPYLIGFLASAVVGYLSIKYLIQFLRSRTTLVFIVYRIILGLALMALALLR